VGCVQAQLAQLNRLSFGLSIAKANRFSTVAPPMGSDLVTAPLQFAPIFMERIWGGRRLGSRYGKQLPPDAKIGESWEITDRPEAQSVVLHGQLAGKTLHELWTNHRREIFGDLPESERFPLLMKLLDAHEKLSLQVHPPAHLAAELGGETKTEFWYIAEATDHAELLVGLRNTSNRDRFLQAIENGDVSSHVHRIPVKAGDALLLPSGRLHAIGAGNLIVEIQQNSDTTYRVFDWNRRATNGKVRRLHIEEALRSIDFEDREPKLLKTERELLVRHELFEIQQWDVSSRREIAPPGRFAVLFCLRGEIVSGGITIKAGEFALVPAGMPDRCIQAQAGAAKILHVTIPE
jgi:mannose-6-phosphate isomerase